VNRVFVRSQYKKYGKFEVQAKKAARAALDFLRKGNVLVEVNLIGNEEMRCLNRKFRKRNKVTNVLSFPEPKNFPHPESRLSPLGEIYLAPDYIVKSGEDLGALAVHGVLHLLGFSHSRESDRMKMEKVEQRICYHG
jgi:probable rRNA maturation factor